MLSMPIRTRFFTHLVTSGFRNSLTEDLRTKLLPGALIRRVFTNFPLKASIGVQ